MFSTFSWHDFLVVLIVVLVIYYTALILVYYRNDISKILREGLPKLTLSTGNEKIGEQADGHDGALEGLTLVFKNAAEKKYHREELMQALQVYLKRYAHLRNTAFQLTMNNHISVSATALCDIYLEDADIRQLW